GQALTAAERAAPPGRLLLADADVTGDLRPLTAADADLAIAAFAERQGGGFRLAKRPPPGLIQALGGPGAREPPSGQRPPSPARPGLGVGGAVDDRRRPRRAPHRGGGAAARPPSDRPRPGRLRPPRAPARGCTPRGRADRRQPPRPAAAGRRLARRPAPRRLA